MPNYCKKVGDTIWAMFEILLIQKIGVYNKKPYFKIIDVVIPPCYPSVIVLKLSLPEYQDALYTTLAFYTIRLYPAYCCIVKVKPVFSLNTTPGCMLILWILVLELIITVPELIITSVK